MLAKPWFFLYFGIKVLLQGKEGLGGLAWGGRHKEKRRKKPTVLWVKLKKCWAASKSGGERKERMQRPVWRQGGGERALPFSLSQKKKPEWIVEQGKGGGRGSRVALWLPRCKGDRNWIGADSKREKKGKKETARREKGKRVDVSGMQRPNGTRGGIALIFPGRGGKTERSNTS